MPLSIYNLSSFFLLADTISDPETNAFSDFVCKSTLGIASILPSSPHTFESLSSSVSDSLPFLGPVLIASMLFDLYVVLKLVITYKVLKIIGGRL